MILSIMIWTERSWSLCGYLRMRYPLPGRGKRGALRLVYLPDAKHERVFMALAYAKNDKVTLTRREEDELRAVARALTGEKR